MRFRLIVLITTPKLAEKAAELFDRGRVPVQCQFHAEGTASSEIMELLGLGSVEKTVMLSVLPKPFGDGMMKKLKKELKIGFSNSGIAASVPLQSGSNFLIRMIESLRGDSSVGGKIFGKGERETVNAYDYSVILAIVNRGFSEDVMNAARAAGAGGGTVINSRRLVNEETMRFWGISIQQEREIVGIIARAEDKTEIMRAITANCGAHSDANGIVMALPADNVIGLD